MDKKNKNYLVVHGHFYQPPRENPWLSEIEIEKSAYPFHDWNDRINAECYRPNAFSKIFDNNGEIVDIVNNYEKMSFNFGPTLLSWIEKNDCETYARILEADEKSCRKFSGHGNAVAQIYNHIIMPLANRKDKDTQIKWGLADFRKRFKREAEGIWLAETAIDYETVDVLIENGVKFTILSPYQADKVRGVKEKEWVDVLGGKVDITKPYRCYSKIDKNRYIDIFFYDGPISSGIGFEDTLNSSHNFMNRIKLAMDDERKHSQIINVATDGETYGHHKKFAELTLSHLLFDLASKNKLEVVNYSYYLSKHNPKDEVILNDAGGEGTAWSCAHGVGRWKEDCGCNTGGNGDWNQKWRKPLRDGLNELRDKLINILENEGKKYLKDVWSARNSYIDVILGRNEKNLEEFFKENQIRVLENDEKVKVTELMELQRNSLLMFTSCGWFFDDISGIEPQQILRYALKAIYIAQEFTNEDLEKVLISYLKQAKSNLEYIGTGEDIFNNYVKSSEVDFNKIVSQYAISSMVKSYEKKISMYNFDIEHEDSYKLVEGGLSFVIGKVKVIDRITLELRHVMYGVLQFGKMDFRCSVRTIFSNVQYLDAKKSIVESLEKNISIVESMRVIDILINRDYFTFKDLLLKEKREILNRVTSTLFYDYKNIYEKIYFESSQLVGELEEAGLDIPAEYKISAEYILSHKLSELGKKFLKDYSIVKSEGELLTIISQAKRYRYSLNLKSLKNSFKENLDGLIKEMIENKKELCNEILNLLKFAELVGIDIKTDYAEYKLFTHREEILSSGVVKKEKIVEIAKKIGFSDKIFTL